MAQIAETLELNDEQRATAQRAFESAIAAASNGGDRRAGMRRAREQVLRELEPTLNARQRELLEQMRQGAGAQREVRRQAVVWVSRNNRPVPVQVEIGVADNSNTLLHSGLDAGDEVIVGGGPRAQNGDQRSPFGGAGRGGARIRGA